MLDPQAWVKLLTGKLKDCRLELGELNAYYDGTQILSFIDHQLQAEMQDRLRPLVFGWPGMVVDSVEERLDVEGFRYADDPDADDEMWRIWQANGLDEGSQMAHLDALIQARSFVICGANAEDESTPLITVESAEQVSASWDPQTRKVRAAVKTWQDPEEKAEYATLYLPNATISHRKDKGKWIVLSTDDHMLGTVPVVPLANRTRTLRADGVSEISQTIRSITDAANKTGTDMMTSVEFHAMPRRWVFGLADADFKDEQGRPLSAWSAIAGRVWASENENAKAGQFPESNLANFHATITALAEQLAAMGCLPPHYVGLLSQNPASADAIRSAEARLIKRAERKQRAFGGSWEQVMRISRRIATGEWDPRALALETIWRDASTPTKAQQADATVKLHAAGIIPTEQAQEDMGYSATQIERMSSQFTTQQARMDAGMSGMLNPPFSEPGPNTPQAA